MNIYTPDMFKIQHIYIRIFANKTEFCNFPLLKYYKKKILFINLYDLYEVSPISIKGRFYVFKVCMCSVSCTFSINYSIFDFALKTDHSWTLRCKIILKLIMLEK